MIGILMKVVTDIKLATIAMMSIMLLALVIGNYKLENNLKASEVLVAEQKVTLVELATRNKLLDNANKSAIITANDETKVIEKKIIEIEKEYVPQIEYVDRFIKVKDETDCEASNRLFNSIVY